MYTGSCGHAYECNKWITGCGNCPQLRNATKFYQVNRTYTLWLKMKNAFDDFDTLKIIFVSQWLKSRASSLLLCKIIILKSLQIELTLKKYFFLVIFNI
jgi:hypothetical protein